MGKVPRKRERKAEVSSAKSGYRSPRRIGGAEENMETVSDTGEGIDSGFCGTGLPEGGVKIGSERETGGEPIVGELGEQEWGAIRAETQFRSVEVLEKRVDAVEEGVQRLDRDKPSEGGVIKICLYIVFGMVALVAGVVGIIKWACPGSN